MKATRRITHIFGWQLDKGRIRKKNEDSLGAAKVKLVSEGAKQSVGLYMIADGIGGMEEGAEASRLAIKTAMQEMMSRIHQYDSHTGIISWLKQAMNEAHRVIRLQQNPDRDTHGTTLLMATVTGQDVYIANVGDSRAYVLRDDELYQITRDHTYAQALVDNGVIGQEEVANHPMGHVLSQAVGLEEIACDTFQMRVDVGDYLLLCSDGLHGYVDEAAIICTIVESESPQMASTALTQAANDAGGKDNIAVIIVEMRQSDAG